MNHICPHCKKKTQQPDRRGGIFKIRCTGCGETFQTTTTRAYAGSRGQARYSKQAGGDK